MLTLAPQYHMHILDAHQHFWRYDPVQYDWIQDSMETLRQDYLPEQLRPIYEANQISGCVAVQASSTEEESVTLLKYADENDFIKGIVGWVDLCKPGVEERLHHFSQHPKFKGVRHVLQNEQVDFMERPDFLHGMASLAPYNLSYDILIYPRHLFSAWQMVKKFPEQKFVIDHLAKPSVKSKQFANWKDLLMNFADCPNVYCKLSGMVTEADWKQWRYPDFVPVLQAATEVFGPDRLMFGSDWPVCLLAASYKNVLDIVKTFTQDWEEEQKDKMFYKNAVQFYNLDASWISE